ncbi:MAG: ferritin family protein [Chloroflexi bacterium]|nr:ferritin family protein [Chloroflexota bacterium]
MATEQDQTLTVLQYAIRMEIDGKEYYLKCSHDSRNSFGKKLLTALAGAEDVHRWRFQQIFDALSAKKAWPKVSLDSPNRELKTIFAEALRQEASATKGATTELEAVKKGIDLETRSYDYYSKQGKAARYAGEKEFYEALAAEEREHHLALLDYQEYLGNPASWFVKKEHSSLDGG